MVADGIFGRRGDAPPGAVVQASTPQTPNQAFTLGDSIFGTQFHVEVTAGSLAENSSEKCSLGEHFSVA